MTRWAVIGPIALIIVALNSLAILSSVGLLNSLASNSTNDRLLEMAHTNYVVSFVSKESLANSTATGIEAPQFTGRLAFIGKPTRHLENQANITIIADQMFPPNSKATNENSKHTYHKFVWKNTIRLLYQHSDHLNEMLQTEPLKVYVYDSLPEEFDVLRVSRCIYDKYQPNQASRSNCNWEPKVCKEVQVDSTRFGMYSKYRNNYNSDVVIIQSFQSYPGRVNDPHEADIYVVPYPHKSHCLCHKKVDMIVRCHYPEVAFQSQILANLLHYNDSTKSRHVFIQSVDWVNAAPYMKSLPLTLTIGDARPCVGKTLCGTLVMPYANTNPEYQPNYLANIGDEWWTNRPRLYSVGAVLGRRKLLKERMEFLNKTNDILGELVQGLPVKVINLKGVRKLARQEEAMEIYRNSTVCPILAGDECPQKRIFDVMMSGCIPVVFRYDASNEQGWPSWYRQHSCSIRVTYPFARGTFFGDEKAGIDWESLVIQVNASCGFPCMKSTIEGVMEDSERLKKLRLRLRNVAALFSYGLDKEANQYPDAFAALLVSLKHYVSKLEP
jgi:hypothetical protein